MTPSEKYLKKLGLKDQDTTSDVTNKKKKMKTAVAHFLKNQQWAALH
jgi:hypothetical protein